MTRRIQLIVSHKIFFVATLLVLALCAWFAGSQAAFAQTTSAVANPKLQAADTAVDAGFKAVFAAEKAGANVTSLLAQLNNAALLLAQAEIANRTGDYSTAVARAESVLLEAQPATASAHITQSLAEVASQDAFWYSIASTAIDAVVFIVILFVGWRWVKAHYMNRFLEAKPEVSG